MEIKFHNTLSGKLEVFEPLTKGVVKMYACGPTVYDYAHIGNFRTFVFEDLLRRFLEAAGFKVTHCMNITDVDDKTILNAAKQNKVLAAFTAEFTQAFNEDMAALHCLAPSMQPSATHEIESMLTLIGRLIEKGAAYESEGSVYFRVSKFPGYGKLSKKKLEMNVAGASRRVDADEYDKEEVTDFVLWKAAKEGEPSWDSPWGKGRPGWHIECSAMSLKHLGETFDLHAGGEDLIFPHHENEIAQSEAATGKPFVRYWLHAKHLLVDGEKMSKSKGNFYTLRDLLTKHYDPMAIRYSLLSTHYRQQLNFTLDHLKEAGEVIRKLDDCYFQCLNLHAHGGAAKEGGALAAKLKEHSLKVMACLADDLNVAQAQAQLLETVKEINTALASGQANAADLEAALAFFKAVDALYGLDVAVVEVIPDRVNQALTERQAARVNPAFKTDSALQEKSDHMRAELLKDGWMVKDTKPGSPQMSTVKLRRRAWD